MGRERDFYMKYVSLRQGIRQDSILKVWHLDILISDTRANVIRAVFEQNAKRT